MTNVNAARGEFTNLIQILERNADTPGAISAGKKDLQQILKDRIQGWIGNTYKVLQKPKGLAKFFRNTEPTEEAYAGAINLFRRYLSKTDNTRTKPFDIDSTQYFEQAKAAVDDIINQVQLKKKPGPLPDFTYQDKTGMVKTKSFEKL